MYLYPVCLCLSIAHELIALRLSARPRGSAFTQGTVLFSRQSTQEELGGAVENVPRDSESDRPKLRKMYSVDVSDSAACCVSRCPVRVPPIPTQTLLIPSVTVLTKQSALIALTVTVQGSPYYSY